MASNIHDRLISCTAFCQIRDEGMPVVVPPSRHFGLCSDISPGRLEGGDGSGRITRTGSSKRKDIPFRTGFAKLLSVPDCVFPQHRKQRRVQRNRAAFSCFCFALANNEIAFCEEDLCPRQPTKFGISDARVERQRECQINVRRTRVGGCLQHALLFFRCVRLTDVVLNLELEFLLLLQSHSQ